MTIQPIGAATAALYCTAGELSAYGFSPATLTPEQALRLIRDARRPAGLPLEPVARLELFPDGEGILIFAYLRPGRPLRPLPVRAPARGRIRRRPT